MSQLRHQAKTTQAEQSKQRRCRNTCDTLQTSSKAKTTQGATIGQETPPRTPGSLLPARSPAYGPSTDWAPTIRLLLRSPAYAPCTRSNRHYPPATPTSTSLFGWEPPREVKVAAQVIAHLLCRNPTQGPAFSFYISNSEIII